jgi:hypothetical protein
MHALVRHAVAFVVIATGGCGSTYSYAPEGATFSVDGALTARIRIPRERPSGEVRVESGGIRSVDEGPQAGTKALHVRITVSNDAGERPWSFDVRDQLIDLPGRGRFRPVAATATYQEMPITVVAARGKRVVDLYYPVDAPVDGFELLWSVHTDDRVVVERTSFGRVEMEPAISYDAPRSANRARVWWQDSAEPVAIRRDARP